MEKKKILNEMSFEEALKELESIVNALDRGEVSLDQAISAYERGAELKDHCEKRLNEAKMKVDKIQISDNKETISEKITPFNNEL